MNKLKTARTMFISLLDCPLCGSAASMTSTTFEDNMTEYYRVECEDGDALDCWDETEDKAKQTWNTRANQQINER